MKKVLMWSGGILLALAGLHFVIPSTNTSSTKPTPAPTAIVTQPPMATSTPKPTTTPSPTPTPTPATPKPTAAPTSKPTPFPTATPTPSCNPNYTPCVPNVSYDLNCADLPYKPVHVIGVDQYHLDRDKDGIGCE